MAKFKRLTEPQARAYSALRALGIMVVSPQDARPLKALKARGLIRYRRIEGVRHAELRKTAAQVAVDRRERRIERQFAEWLKYTTLRNEK